MQIREKRMNASRYIALVLVLSIVVPMTLTAQSGGDGIDSNPSLAATGRFFGDSIVLRWGATSYPAWQAASRGGFVIERTDPRRAKNGEEWELLTPTPIMPLTIEEWKRSYRPEDTLAGAAVQTLYGGTVTTESDPFGSIYETYLQQQNLVGFAMLLADVAPRLADGLGLRFVDRTIEPGLPYIYRVRSLADDPTNPIGEAIAVVATDTVIDVPSIMTLSAVEQEKSVRLRWLRDEHPVPFSGYFIEESFDGGASFSRRKEIPFIPANNPEIADIDEGSFDTVSYEIKLAENYRPVVYRVVGLDPFGETSPESVEVTAMGRDRTPPTPVAIMPITVEPDAFRLQWGHATQQSDDLAGYIVGRSPNAEGPFAAITDLLPATTTSYLDERVDTLLPSYYVVGAVDTTGNFRNSVAVYGILPDSIAPETPQAVGGTIDSNGIVTLHWAPAQDADIRGYRVFFANQADHEFQQLTEGTYSDTLWQDTLTLTTLTEEIFFRVTAYDQNFNHAPFSEILTLKKPDIIAPVAPVITDVEPSEQSITIRWYRSPSGDALAQTIYRRAAGSDVWQELYQSDDQRKADYTDTLVERGRRYEYALRTVDDDGNLSDLSNVVTTRTIDDGLRPGIDRVTALFDSTASRVAITWEAASERTGRVELYRSVNDGRAGLLGSFDVADGRASDHQIIPGATYQYRLRIVSDDGGESGLIESNSVTLGR